MNTPPKKTTRRAYGKPMIQKVKLLPEEAVLANCKGAGSGGKKTRDCKPWSSSCKSTFGS